MARFEVLGLDADRKLIRWLARRLAEAGNRFGANSCNDASRHIRGTSDKGWDSYGLAAIALGRR